MNAIVFHVEPVHSHVHRKQVQTSLLCVEITKLMGYCTIFCHCNHLLFIHYGNHRSVVLS